MPKKKDESKLTAKEERFCQNIANGMSNIDAYYKAGYRGKDRNKDRGTAWRLKQKPYIEARINELMKMIEDETIMSRREVLQKLTKMALGITTEENIVSDKEGNYNIVETKVKGKEQAKALELLGKFYKLYTEKQQIDGEIGVKVVFEGEEELED